MPTTPLFGEEIIISELESDEYEPAIAYNSIQHQYLVVWENKWGTTPGSHHDIYAQRLTSTGQLLSWFAVSVNSNSQTNPSVAYDPVNDRYLVVWVYDVNGDGSDWDVYGRFIPWNGPDPALGDFMICNWTSSQTHPVVAYALAQQEFLVVWQNQQPLVADYISARRVYADGGGFPDDAFSITSGADNRAFPDVAYNLARNEYLVTWDVELSVSDTDIYGLRLTGTGGSLGGEFVIAGWPDDEERSSVAACDQADQYLVAWQSDQGSDGSDYAIFARRLTGDGLLYDPFEVDNTLTPETQVDVSCNADGQHYLLAWQSGHGNPIAGVWARVAYPTGAWGPTFNVVLPGASESRGYPAIGGGRSNFLVTWEHQRIGGNLDIHGQLVGYGVYLPLLER
jgi:hypothetical protein